ncbi:ATP-dependent DNA helicase PcrA [Bifidobacterium adolescentis]|nr:ATP-dependent DNA helicase PcrA [Bifidobacterium adolescentis]
MGPVMCDPRSLIEGLNPQQEEAVKYYGQALLIGAGAGSGKTRVLTRRIAWLLAHGFWASSILAITFTNKAAAEMRERLVTLVGPEAEHMWISTFHSACVRILRRDGKEIGLKSGFSIYDTADSERLVKLIAADLNIDTKRYTPRMLLGKISDCKNALVSWKDQLKKANCDYTPGQRGYQVSAGDGDQLVAVAGAHLVSTLSRGVIAVRFFQLVFPGNQRVLAVGYLAQQHAWRIPLRIDVQVGCDQFDQSLAVRGVVNREARFKADFLAVAA